MIIAPSILSMHFDDFREEVAALNEAADWIHFDVMDGHFVPNLTFGPDIFKTFRRNSPLFLDVHLMVSDPNHYAEVFARAGADSIVFHYEAYNDLDKCLELLRKIRHLYLKAGISIKPGTSPETILPLLKETDIVLLMSVEPGFGGQKFMPEVLEKVRMLREYREINHLNYLIEVDGGINDQNVHELSVTGTDCIVAGSAVFNGDIKANIEKLRKCA